MRRGGSRAAPSQYISLYARAQTSQLSRVLTRAMCAERFRAIECECASPSMCGTYVQVLSGIS